MIKSDNYHRPVKYSKEVGMEIIGRKRNLTTNAFKSSACRTHSSFKARGSLSDVQKYPPQEAQRE
jgi:hypothetical protein